MPVVFLDGVDGSGKTTMIRRLAQDLHVQPVHIADPLWRYLPAVTVPADFPDWVTTTPAADVAVDLLDACVRRLDQIRHHLATPGPASVILVDRGPRTVAASARAHLATGATTASAADPDAAMTRLRTTAMQVALADTCVTVELKVESYDAILHRLADSERADAQYLRYLRALLCYFQNEVPWPGVRRITLDATANIAANVASVRAKF